MTMIADGRDVEVLRELVRRYVALCEEPVQDERRRLWRDLNSLQPTRPLIYVRGGRCWNEVSEVTRRECEDDFFASYERWLREYLFRGGIGDDFIFEPWLTVPAVYRQSGWGLELSRHYADDSGCGSWKADYPIKDLDDVAKLTAAAHDIDDQATARRAERLADAVGDLITVNVDRGPTYGSWPATLSTSLGHFRGIENFMLDMMDHPAWLHELMAFMRDAVLADHEQAEAAGDWSLASHDNQSMPYCHELADPAADACGVRRRDLWCFSAAQEFELVSPAMHEEFLFNYQRPIMEAFGLVAYGCCENLTRKIDMLRTLPNLRRIAVAPRADVAACAEQIGTDYVFSYRPNPADVISCGFDADRIRRIIRRDLDITRGLHVEISLKDVDTIENDPTRLKRWTDLVRPIAQEYA